MPTVMMTACTAKRVGTTTRSALSDNRSVSSDATESAAISEKVGKVGGQDELTCDRHNFNDRSTALTAYDS